MISQLKIKYLELLKESNDYLEKPNNYPDKGINPEHKYNIITNEYDEEDLDKLFYILLSLYPKKDDSLQEIISDGLKILENNKKEKILEINKILLREKETTYIKYFESLCGCKIDINYDSINDINKDNVKEIKDNFNKIIKLLEDNPVVKAQAKVVWNKIRQIEKYLLCYYLYNAHLII